MAARGRDGDSLDCRVMSAYLRKVSCSPAECSFFLSIFRHRFLGNYPKYPCSFCLSTKCLDEFREVRECAHFYSRNKKGFAACLKRNEYPGNTRSSRRYYRGQNSRKSMQTTVQRKFANEDLTCNSCALDLRRCQKYRGGNGEIKSRARFWKPGGRKSDRNVSVENFQLTGLERRANTIASFS